MDLALRSSGAVRRAHRVGLFLAWGDSMLRVIACHVFCTECVNVPEFPSRNSALAAFTENHLSKHYPIYSNHRLSSCRCGLLEQWIEYDVKMSSQSLLFVSSFDNYLARCVINMDFSGRLFSRHGIFFEDYRIAVFSG
jgi:hypothetical protein